MYNTGCYFSIKYFLRICFDLKIDKELYSVAVKTKEVDSQHLKVFLNGQCSCLTVYDMLSDGLLAHPVSRFCRHQAKALEVKKVARKT